MKSTKGAARGIARSDAVPGPALRDACLAEIDRAETTLASAGRHPHRAVHHARKAIRRARAALALGGFDDAEAGATDKALRRLARALSRLRDAAVAVETYDRTVKHAALRAEAASLRPLRTQLIARRDETLSAYRRRDPAFEPLRANLLAVRDKVCRLSWDNVDLDAVAHALSKTSRRAEKAAAKARGRFEETVRHRWRRRLRRLNDQRVLIGNLMAGEWPTGMTARQEFAARLAEIEAKHPASWHRLAETVHALGVEHDARLLRRIARSSTALDDAAKARLVAALNHRLHKLRKRTAK